MKNWLLTAAIATALFACNSKKSSEKEPVKADTASVGPVHPVKNGADTAVGEGNYGGLGDFTLGMTSTRVKELLGEPTTKSKPEEWGADGLTHEDWTYKDKGISINLSKDAETGEQTVFSVAIVSPSQLKTTKGIGIGSTYDEVKSAYGTEIDETASDKDAITVGSVYGGIVVNFKDGKANMIFLGAAAE